MSKAMERIKRIRQGMDFLASQNGAMDIKTIHDQIVYLQTAFENMRKVAITLLEEEESNDYTDIIDERFEQSMAESEKP